MSEEKQTGKWLGSWKEVAEYLGVSVRTTQKWEAERNLPIHRASGARGRVSADTGELDRWRETAFLRSSNSLHLSWFRSRYAVAACFASIAILLVVGAWGWHRIFGRDEPFLFRIERSALVVSDNKGQECWRQVFPQPLAEAFYQGRSDWAKIADIDGDGHQEVLFINSPATLTAQGSAVICYNSRGDEKWHFVPGREVHSSTEQFPPPYRANSLGVVKMRREGKFAVAVVSFHNTYYPTQVALLSADDGHLRTDYWHSGHLPFMLTTDLHGDGQEDILLGGSDNAFDAATLIVLDPNSMAGASQEENPKDQLVGFAPGTEKVRLLFPRSCINLKLKIRNAVASMRVDEKSLMVQIAEDYTSAGPIANSIYVFDHAFNIVNCQFGDDFHHRHAELEASGLLDHPYSPMEEARLKAVRRLR